MGLCAERVRALLHYSPETGVFTWRDRDLTEFSSLRAAMAFRARKVGVVAGCVSKISGYREIKLDGATYKAHRLAWLHVNGELPSLDLDHINGDRDDNRMSNLRVASRVDNGRNKKRPTTNTSGAIGVRWHAQLGKWIAQIKLLGRSHHLGLFDIFDDAVAARKKADAEHGFHANHGRAA